MPINISTDNPVAAFIMKYGSGAQAKTNPLPPRGAIVSTGSGASGADTPVRGDLATVDTTISDEQARRARGEHTSTEFITTLLDQIRNNQTPFVRFGERLSQADTARMTDKNYQETLRLSRLADALNNQYFLSPGTPGVHHAGRLGTVDRAETYGTPFKMPVETQEMREMRRGEELNQEAAQREIKRQQDAQDLSVAWQQLQVLEDVARTRALTEEEARRRNELWDTVLNQQYTDPYKRYWDRQDYKFKEQLAKLDIPNAQYNAVNDLYNKGYVAESNILLSLYNTAATMPDPTQKAWLNQTLGPLMQQLNATGDTDAFYAGIINAYGQMAKLFGTEGVNTALDTGSAVVNNLTGGGVR
jgi:hypothetical protein